MAKRLILRQGTQDENDVFTGAKGELTFVNDGNRTIRWHDGATVGGHPLAWTKLADYTLAVTGTAGAGSWQWVKCERDSFVYVSGADPYTEGYGVYVNSTNTQQTGYLVGWRADDTNSQTQHVSFYFFCPGGWYFCMNNELASSYAVYPIIGSKRTPNY